MDISSTRHLGRRRLVRGSGEDDLQNLFASSFLWKDEKPLTHHMSSKYDAGQEIRTGTTEPSGISIGEILNHPKRDCGTGLGLEGGRGILQH